MQSIVRWLAVVVAWSGSTLLADEVWTYKFIVNGSRPVVLGCDCAAPLHADVAGTFSILVDWQHATGKLLQLNDHLTNFAYELHVAGGPLQLTPANMPEADYGIVPRYYTARFETGNFVPTDGTHWRIESKPVIGWNSDPYGVNFNNTTASLDLLIAIDDGGAAVINATAVFDSATIAGDYNGDLRADARDYVTLRNSGRSQFDFNLWRSYFGTSLSTGGAAASGAGVPEPLAGLLCGNGAGVLLSFRRRRTA